MKWIRTVALACCASAFSLAACAERPDFAGGPPAGREHPGRDGPDQPGTGRHEIDHREMAARHGHQFDHRQRDSVRSYYAPRFKAGHCPPGLAKKHNACLPPGQARKWELGQPLPAGLARHPLPAELLRRLGPPPAGHEYAQVESDILLLTIGTSMVIDAIENLGLLDR
ncbi:MAG: hypothetical protein RLZZ555_985 [Pseudomonadota bacterium]|jgi:Ni/Co efflux regulator RcnB